MCIYVYNFVSAVYTCIYIRRQENFEHALGKERKKGIPHFRRGGGRKLQLPTDGPASVITSWTPPPIAIINFVLN